MGNNVSTPASKEYTLARETRLKSLQLLEQKRLHVDTNDEVGLDVSKLLDSHSEMTKLDQEASLANIDDYRYPFENLIFEGGGIKGVSYVGCLKCLESVGITPQIKRIAGTSVGSIFATYFALGYNSTEIEKIFTYRTKHFIYDHSFGYLSLLPNLLKHYGWNPGEAFHKRMGEVIANKTGNPDFTFYDLYRQRGMELCIVITNVNLMKEEYCHVKTTPNMPIRDAVRMSISIPGVFTAKTYDNHGQEDIFVDGGVLCSYPVHCFDGWYLSMSPEDSFLQKLTSLQDFPHFITSRFEGANMKSLGFILYDEAEFDLMRLNLEKRIGCNEPLQPNKMTKLYKLKQHKKKVALNAKEEFSKAAGAVHEFLKVLTKNGLTNKEFIDKSQLAEALQDKETFTEEHRTLLFGTDMDIDKVFCLLDSNGDGNIAFLELMQFIEEHGVRMQTRFQAFGRRQIDSFSQFLTVLSDAMLTNLKFIFFKSVDEQRTVGINTGYIETANYDLDKEDIEFIIERGYNATKSFLKYYVASHPDIEKKF